MSSKEAIYEQLGRIPSGTVVCYGQLAELAGIARGARIAAAALKTLDPDCGLPWHRVIGKRNHRWGEIRIKDPVGGALQRALLEAEGIEITEKGRVDLTRFSWLDGS